MPASVLAGVLQALCFLGQLQAPENLYDATLYFGGNANRRSRTQHTTGTVRNSASARWRQSNRSRTPILRTKSMSERNIVGRASLDRLTSQEEQHEGKAEFNISVKI